MLTKLLQALAGSSVTDLSALGYISDLLHLCFVVGLWVGFFFIYCWLSLLVRVGALKDG